MDNDTVGVAPTKSKMAPAPPAVALQGPRILEAHQWRGHQERVGDFLHLAGDEISRLHSRVRDAGYCVMLTDTLGCAVDYRIESTIRGEYRRAGIDVGTCWSESEEG